MGVVVEVPVDVGLANDADVDPAVDADADVHVGMCVAVFDEVAVVMLVNVGDG